MRTSGLLPLAAGVAALCLGLAARVDAEDLEALRESLRKGTPDQRRAAVAALAKLGPKAAPALPDLIAALKADRRTRIPEAAAAVLAKIGPSADVAVGPVVAVSNQTQATRRSLMAIPLTKRSIPGLIALFKHEDPRVRADAIHALHGLGPTGREALVPVARLFRDENGRFPGSSKKFRDKDRLEWRALILIRAARWIQDCVGDGKAEGADIDKVLELMTASLKVVKDWGFEGPESYATAQALQTFGPRAIPALLDVLENGNLAAKVATAGALPVPPDADVERVVTVLAKLLKEGARASYSIFTQNESWVARGAATSLGRLGVRAKAALPDLKGALANTNPHLKAHAARAILNIEPKNAEARAVLLSLLAPTSKAKQTAVVCVRKAKARGDDFKQAVGKLLKDEDPWVKVEAATTLHALDPADPRSIATLTACAKEGDSRLSAAQALQRIDPENEVTMPALIGLLSDEVVASFTVRTLLELGPRAGAAVPALKKLIQVRPATLEAWMAVRAVRTLSAFR